MRRKRSFWHNLIALGLAFALMVVILAACGEEKDGDHDYVYPILQDAQGNLWFATWDGVSRYDGDTWQTFTKKDGLASDHVYAIIQDDEGNLWFGTRCGVSRYDGDTWQTFR